MEDILVLIVLLEKARNDFFKPIHIRFTIYNLSRLSKFETYYKNLPPNFGKSIWKSHYMDTKLLVTSFETDNSVTDLKSLQVKKIRYVSLSN